MPTPVHGRRPGHPSWGGGGLIRERGPSISNHDGKCPSIRLRERGPSIRDSGPSVRESVYRRPASPARRARRAPRSTPSNSDEGPSTRKRVPRSRCQRAGVCHRPEPSRQSCARVGLRGGPGGGSNRPLIRYPSARARTRKHMTPAAGPTPGTHNRRSGVPGSPPGRPKAVTTNTVYLRKKRNYPSLSD
jgi:hypothetical protein